MTKCQITEERNEGKPSRSVLETSGIGDSLAEFNNYHRYCNMKGSRFSLWYINHRAFKVFNKEKKQNKHSTRKLIDIAFPAVSHRQNKYINVKGNKSPYDGDLIYWSQRNSKLYDGTISKVLKRQNHSCARCGLKTTSEEQVHLHHKDGNHHNWNERNLEALHESCHDYIHMSKRHSLIESEAG